MDTRTQPAGLGVLVGAGPGDASLATAAALDWLARADVVLYDRLAAPDLLDACRHDAERLYVGKRPDQHAMSQERINQLLVERVRAGDLVVRLKGGDPLVFGRGGEEAEALAEAGLPFRIVPGVTAAIAAGAFAGIPLTDRRAASAVAFVTGHEDPSKDESTLDYTALAGVDTLVFYMGVGNLPKIVDRLIDAGRDPATPAAVVANAARADQLTVTATLATIAGAAAEAGLRPPAVVVVGEVVRLRDRLAWREKLPLAGQTVLVTRTRTQASRLARKLAELGARAVEAPTIAVRPPEDYASLDRALDHLREFDWLAVTSPNGASAVLDRLRHRGLDGRALSHLRIAAIGPATADVLTSRFLHPDLVPERYTTEALGEALAAAAAESGHVLLARADIATDTLPNALRAGGASVVEAVAYRTVRPDALAKDAAEALADGSADWITFTSSSTVENFLALASPTGASLDGLRFASIGPVTSRTLRDHGIEPTVEADVHTIDGLVDAMVRHRERERG